MGTGASAVLAPGKTNYYPRPMSSEPKGRRRPRRVSEFLRPGGTALGKLLSRAREIERLDRKVAALLEPGLADRVQVAALRDGCMVLVTPSAALATRLRMDAGHLLDTLQANGEKAVREVSVRVAPIGRESHEEPRRRPLPDSARQALERFAADSGDEEIQAIIRRGNTEDS